MTIIKRHHLVVFSFAALLATTGYCDEHYTFVPSERGIESARVIVRHDEGDPFSSPISAEPASIRVPGPVLNFRLPGEFEPQRALLLACNDLIDDMPDLFANIVRQTSGRIKIISLVSNVEQCEAAKQLLQAGSIPSGHVHFVELPHDTMWARDYGPIIVNSKAGHPIVIDAGYDLSREKDDRVPRELARLLSLRVVSMPLRLDGGNLLSNGDGLAITTSRLFDENAFDESAFGETDYEPMRAVLRRSYGLKRVAVLEPLADEPTGHVDMFATFTSQNTVVVGQYDPEIDPDNAEILDRNARRLSALQTAKGPLQVVRIPMPSNEDGVWRTYTNVIYANSVLLVPTYAEVDQPQRTQALHTYAKLLPQWKVVGIDASRIIESSGALHCMTMNLGPLGRLPDFPPPRTHAVDETDELEITDNRSFLLANQAWEIPTRPLFRAAKGDGNGFSRLMTWIHNATGPRRELVRSQMLTPQRFQRQEVGSRGFIRESP